MRAPTFWNERHWIAWLLLPCAWLYYAGMRLRARLSTPYRARCKVICVGNVVAGGAGKTPIAVAIAEYLLAKNVRIACLSKGYGGVLRGPLWVDPAKHTAQDVGDEALLLAATCPTIVARNRVEALRFAEAANIAVAITDDGFQNPTFAKDISLLVVDGKTGLGNGWMLPAGPLREPLEEALGRTQGVVMMQEDNAALRARIPASLPVLQAHIRVKEAEQLHGRYIAFAGIGQPLKFYLTLQSLGATVVEMVGFADHHPYSEADMRALKTRADAAEATLITTAKDAVRLPKSWRSHVRVVHVEAVFEAPDALSTLLSGVGHVA